MVEQMHIITYHTTDISILPSFFGVATSLTFNLLHHNLLIYRQKKDAFASLSAEREGFEPPVPLSTSVFKTDAIDHSAISPKMKGILNFSIPFLYALRDSNPGPID